MRGRFFNSYDYTTLWAPISAAELINSTEGSSTSRRGSQGGGVADMTGALFLYRSNDGLGKWIVTDRERDFVCNKG